MKLINGGAFKRMFNKNKSLHVDLRRKTRPYTLISDFEPATDSSVVYDPTAGGLRILFTVVILVVAALLQESLFNGLRILDVKPNLVLVCMICFATCSTERFALFMGAIGGTLMDIAYGRVVGFYGLVFMYVAFITSMILKDSFKAKPSSFFMYTPIYTFLVEMFVSLSARVLNVYISGHMELYQNYGYHLIRRILPASIYDALLALLLIWPITTIWLNLGKSQMKDSRMFK